MSLAAGIHFKRSATFPAIVMDGFRSRDDWYSIYFLSKSMPAGYSHTLAEERVGVLLYYLTETS